MRKILPLTSRDETSPLQTAKRGLVYSRAVTFRALLIAAILSPLNIMWLLGSEGMGIFSTSNVSGLALLFNCLFILLVLMLVNRGLARLAPTKVLQAGELLVIYILLTGVTAMCGEGIVQTIVPFIAFPIRYVRPENAVEQRILELMPNWLILSDKATANGFWLGETGLFSDGYWRAWLTPVLSWTLLLGLIIFGLHCLSVLVRQAWADHERLTFPLTQLPLQLLTGQTFFCSRLLWGGIGFSILIAAVNGLHQLIPAIPGIPTRFLFDIYDHPLPRPWNNIETNVAFLPFVAGIGFFMPLSLAFATWFFVFIQNVELVFASLTGWDGGGFPYLSEQAIGAFFVIILMRLMMEKKYFLHVFTRAFARASTISDTGEAVSYRLALLGFLASVAGLGVMCLLMGFGSFATLLFVSLLFLQFLGVARIRAELGPPAHDLFWGNEVPSIIIYSLGSRAFSETALVGLAGLMRSFLVTSSGNPMPYQLEGFQMAKRLGVSGKNIFWSMLIFMVISIPLGMLLMIGVEHYLGAATAKGSTSGEGEVHFLFKNREYFWNPLVSVISDKKAQNTGAIGGLISGAGVAVILSVLSARFVAWPLPALGFVIARSDFIYRNAWFSIFMAWLIKSLFLRYGGRAAYVKALPLFFGFIIGDCLAGVAWSFISFLLHAPTYSVWY